MKKSHALIIALITSLPLVSEGAGGLQGLLISFGNFINTTIIPFLFGLAFLFFVINAIRFFVIGGNNEDGQKKAKSLALYGVGAFVFLAIFWSIINLLVGATDLSSKPAPCSDYMIKMGVCTNSGDTYRSEGQNYPPSTNNPNYSNEGVKYKLPGNGQTDPADGANQGPDWYQTDPGYIPPTN